MKRHSLVQISLFFKEIKFTHLKSTHFYLKTPNKQMLVLFKQVGEKV